MINKTTLRFIVVGAAGFVCNSVVLSVAEHFGIHKIISEIIGMLVSLQLTFILHDRWTYIDEESSRQHYHRPLRKRYYMYLFSNSFGSLLTVILFTVFSLFLQSILSLAIASLISMSWNYTANKIFIWKYRE